MIKIDCPRKLTGKQFEELCLFRGRAMNTCGVWHLSRYGVQVSQMKDPVTGAFKLQPMESLPDFEAAVAPNGSQVIFDCKVCSQSSYKLSLDGKSKKRQLDHMFKRSAVGAKCYLLIHFNGRTLKTRVDDPFTIAITVDEESELMCDVLSRGTKTISRYDAQLYGVPVPWNMYSERARKLTPDLGVLIEVY